MTAPFRDRARKAIERARADVLDRAGLRVDVYVGPLHGRGSHDSGGAQGEGPAQGGASTRAAALALLSGYPDGGRDLVLVAVDPAARRLEIVSGPEARARIDDRTAALVALGMTSSFQAGDLAGGLVHGIHMLGEHARPLSARAGAARR